MQLAPSPSKTFKFDFHYFIYFTLFPLLTTFQIVKKDSKKGLTGCFVRSLIKKIENFPKIGLTQLVDLKRG